MASIRLASRADAVGIVDLLKACYGTTYTVDSALDPVAVGSKIDSGQEIYAVAETHQGLVGFGVLSCKGPGLFDYHRCVVHEAARGQGLMRRLIQRAIEHAEALGARLITTGLVTSHPYAQRSVAPLGFAPMGLLAGLIPDFTEVAGIGRAVQPVSLLMLGRRVEGRRLRARQLALPEPECSWARTVLDGLGIPSQAPAWSTNRHWKLPLLGWTLEQDSSIGLSHIRFHSDQEPTPYGELLVGLEARQRLIWADVPAEEPRAGSICEDLRERGFGFAAYLPLSGPTGEDIVRFQRYLDPCPLEEQQIQVLPQWAEVRSRVFLSLESACGVAA